MRITRRGTQVALGLFWLLDGVLQLQPYLLTRGFATGVIAPAGVGQPGPVHAAVRLSAAVIGSHPVAFDVVFALVQLLLGAGLLWPRTVRLALTGSIGWALGVWVFGEGLGGVLGGQANLLSGAPGAALLYVVLAAAAWPSPRRDRPSTDRPATWLPRAWASLWVGAAVLQLLPGELSGTGLRSTFSGSASAVPGVVLAGARTLTSVAGRHGLAMGLGLAGVELAVGAAALGSGRSRAVSAVAGSVLALAAWVFAQGFGGLGSGQATDPDTGPLLVLLAVAMVSAGYRPTRAAVIVHAERRFRAAVGTRPQQVA
ncbi:MAG TPA: hypothetical protein VNE21_02760 [Mycobacteriales bacterium]|nr:hypothetical protein [Mycobacteriales bacterium]